MSSPETIRRASARTLTERHRRPSQSEDHGVGLPNLTHRHPADATRDGRSACASHHLVQPDARPATCPGALAGATIL